MPNESKTEGKTVNHDVLVDKWDLFAKRKTPPEKNLWLCTVWSSDIQYVVTLQTTHVIVPGLSIFYYVTVYVRKIRKC